jgi:hypothetical protein
MTEGRLDRCSIPSPCPVSWNSMSGTDVTRTCATCARQVHDLSTMTTAEAEALIFRDTERICVRYVRGADGAILTADRLVKIQKGPYAGLSAAALAAVVALSQPACSTPANQATVSERERPASNRVRVSPELTQGTLSGHVDTWGNRGIDGARVVAISESTGEEHITQSGYDGEFSLELPPGSYTISVTHEFFSQSGEGGVEVQSGQISTRKIELRPPVMGEVVRIYPNTPPPPLPELNEPPMPPSSSKSSIGDMWERLVERTTRLLR